MKKILYFLVFIYAIPLHSESHFIYKDIPYVSVTDKDFDQSKHILDVYVPRVKNKQTEVLVFIHGGKWVSGNKDMYNYIGVNFAEKGKAVVIINYRHSPDVKYEAMAMDCANALKWVQGQIEYYGGDKNKIYISGHSAGGHLAALITVNNRFFDSLQIQNPIKGCVLIDAFGMDLHTYFTNDSKTKDFHEEFKDVFSNDSASWKDASPIYFLKPGLPKFLLYVGDKTVPVIRKEVPMFHAALIRSGNPAPLYILPNKKHLDMVIQFFDFRCEAVDTIIKFMQN